MTLNSTITETGYLKMIVGLGNPGKDYEHTRHNVGFDVITKLASDLDIGAGAWKAEHRAHTARAMIGTEKVILVKPQTYMNNSGEAVREITDYYKVDPESELIVLYDDISLPVGTLRIRDKGSAGGHNGIKSIIAHLGTDGFKRVKIGAGGKKEGQDLADHVLSTFSKAERMLVDSAIEDAASAAVLLTEDRAEDAMSMYNGKKEE